MKRTILLSLIVCVCMLTACRFGEVALERPVKKHVFAMDTTMTLTAYGKEARRALSDGEEELYRLEQRFSVTDQSSELSQLNASAGQPFHASDMLLQQLQTARALYQTTGGSFDPSVFPIVKAWGFTTDEKRVPKQQEIDELMQTTGYGRVAIEGEQVTLPPGMELDLGALTKGYASDRLIDLFRQRGVTSALVSLGGDVQVLGTKPDGSKWRVALQDPTRKDAFLATLEVADAAVMTSGGYERCFEQDGVRYHHIINPSSGYPAENELSSVTVVCSSGLLADGLSTALFVMGLPAAIDYWRANPDFEAVFITKDQSIYITQPLVPSVVSLPTEYNVIPKQP